ncbi:hypothetical protein [Streptomyces sp. NBC_01565]|uniref:hypothetical protein n=1 Tax=unclassified Streptomyces TaxID=2593676 RepID=UPI002253D69D|nr:hypothetical protein [Streptomyces sp. NBC_01565]MCX4547159.1 hypothetical protein [Streptomyces sp. NBC_01565]
MIGEFFHATMGNSGPTLDERPQDGLITAMQRVRTVLGIVAAVWLVVAYPLAEGGQEFLLGKLVELGISCGILVVGSILGIAVFLIAGTPERRRTFARRLLGPLTSILALALGPALMWLSVTTVKGDLVDGGDLKDFFVAIVGTGVISSVLAFLVLVIGWLLAIVVLIASIPYTIAIAYACVFSCFRTSDVHQLLPALISPLLVWSLFAFQVFNGPDVAAPPEVLYTFMLGGPLSVTALSLWEVRRLRSHHGITLRTALGR